jgi:hypothetical protein
MSANDRVANITGELALSSEGGVGPIERVPFNFTTGTFQIIQKFAFTLATGANRTITVANLGMSNDVHLLYIKARDVTTGLPRTVEVTFTSSGVAQGGIATVNPSAIVLSDLIMTAYDIQDLTAIDILASTVSANDTEVILFLGGD